MSADDTIADIERQLAEWQAAPLLAGTGRDKEREKIKKEVLAISQRALQHKKEEEEKAARRQREAALAARETVEVDPSDEEAARRTEEELHGFKAMVEEKLQEADAGADEPPTFTAVIQPVQALPQLQLQHLAMVQELVRMSQQVLGSSSSSNSSNDANSTDGALAVAAFTTLLEQRDVQLRICPGEDVAQATFQAVCFGSSDLARAAYRVYMGWCGMTECQAGSSLADITEDGWALTDSIPALAGISIADQQPPTTVQWLPSAHDVVDALNKMGCSTSSSTNSSTATPAAGKKGRSSGAAAAAATPDAAPRQQLLYADHNMKLLLQLLAHMCRLGSCPDAAAGAQRLPLQQFAADTAATKQLLLLLLRLLLDERALLSCAGALQAALSGVLGLVSSSKWGNMEKQLLEAVGAGMGPSNRSTIMLLSQLPLTERGVSLRQQGALQLLAKLVKKQLPQQSRSSRGSSQPSSREAHNALVGMLGKEPERALIKSLTREENGKKQLDTWALITILDAAHLVLWPDVVGAGGPRIDASLRTWFLHWMTRLSFALGKSLTNALLKNRLTEFNAAYEFSVDLGVAAGSSGASEDADADEGF